MAGILSNFSIPTFDDLDSAKASDIGVTGTDRIRVQTASYTGGWAAFIEQPSGGAEYDVVTAVEFTSITGGVPDEIGDHTMANTNVLMLDKSEGLYVTTYGVKFDNSTDNSTAMQAVVDSGATKIIFAEGIARFTNVAIPTDSHGGFTFEGGGNSELTSTGTWLSNNGATPLFTTTGTASLISCKFNNISFNQVSAASGHILELVDSYFNFEVTNCYCILSNTASSFWKSANVYPAMWRINKTKVVMATGATVPGIDIVSTTGQPTFGWEMQDFQINSEITATAVAVKIHDGSGNTNAGGRINGFLAQNTYAGALELGSQQMITIIGMQTADIVTPNATAPMVLIKKVGTNSSYNVTMIGCDIQGGDATNPDVKVEVASAQGGLNLINSRVDFLEAVGQGPVILGGIFEPTLIGATNPVFLARTGRLRGIAGISQTADTASNLRGSVTVISGGPTAVVFAGSEPDANYFIATSQDDTIYTSGISNKTASGFDVSTTTGGGGSDVIDWIMIR